MYTYSALLFTFRPEVEAPLGHRLTPPPNPLHAPIWKQNTEYLRTKSPSSQLFDHCRLGGRERGSLRRCVQACERWPNGVQCFDFN